MRKIALIACLTLVIGLMGIFTFRDQIFSIGNGDDITEEQSVEASEVDQIDIEVDVVDVAIEKSSDSEIHVFLEGNVNERVKKTINFNVHQNNRSLDVNVERDSRNWFSFLSFGNFGSLQLTVQIPDQQAFDQLIITSNVGEINVKSAEFSNVDVTTDVGDVYLQGITSKSATIVSNVGDVNVSQAVGSWDIQMDVGEIDLELKELKKRVNIKSDVGDIEVYIMEKPTDYAIDLTSDIGDVSLTGFDQYNQNNESRKDIYIENGTAQPLLRATSDIGDIDVSTH